MLAQLQLFEDNNGRPLDCMNMGTLLTRLPRVIGTREIKLKVMGRVNPDVEYLIRRGFPHPEKGTFNTQSLANVVWGMLQLGLGNQ